MNSSFVDSLTGEKDLSSQRLPGVRDKELDMGGVGWSKSHRRGRPIPGS